jgi:hypothetical protein
LKDGLGRSRWITADTFDRATGGIGITIMSPLQIGSVIPVRGKLGEDQNEIVVQANVRWCVESSVGVYRAGLEFVDESRRRPPPPDSQPHSETPPPKPTVGGPQEELDYYEILQLSPKADTETIHRVYRILAQRYHPDNLETGNPEWFVQISEAHAVLGDPERRAGYDAQHRRARQLRWKIFDQSAASVGLAAEVNKRRGILGLLYAKTLHDPERATLTIHDFEELLGCPREHLDAALWYLKGKGYIQRSDGGRYNITIPGFEQAELHAAAQPEPAPAAAAPDFSHQLPAPYRNGK